ncbi:ABC transporter ATP-binding protein [Paenibacillus mesotrionivorans]|jgi:ATP-binding cassette subfamily B protein|uniref:ABC transporter ATP-binding protein n=1 Tax=Paenibacillus mesotrionivorans TaxID=3160968 RepID=A0ACC7NZ54_9BACL
MFKLVGFLKPFRKETIAGPFFKLLEAILELLLPTVVALIVNNGIGRGDKTYVLQMGLLMIGMAILGYGCSLVCQHYAARASQGFGTNLRNALFKHISSLSYTELDRFGTPSLINRLTSDVNQLQLAVAMLIRLVIRAPFICVGAIIMAMILDLKLSLILLVAAPIIGVILYFIISRTAPLYRRYQGKLDRMGSVLSENLTGVRVIRAFAKGRAEQKRFKETSEDLTGTAIHVGRIAALLNPATSLVVNGAIILILWAGGLHIDSGSLSQGEIIAFINYVTQILLALIVVSNLVIIFTKAASSGARVSEVLATEPSIADGKRIAGAPARVESSKGTSTLPADGAQSSVTPVSNQPAIAFESVSFGYSATGELALDDISLSIAKGETIGIIGGTGSGKSTLVNLIPRFYDAVKGSIRVNGIDVKDYQLQELRRLIGVVPQKAMLFTGTVAENIRWGNPGATAEEVAEAAQTAQAAEFITKLPEGYNTVLVRGGLNLSGGQKQRLTIARALASKPEILILDDSASALDYATDAALRKGLRETAGDKTLLIVSQRVSSVRHADRILVLDDGKIAGLGTHEELLETCQVYQEVCQSQLSGEEAVS